MTSVKHTKVKSQELLKLKKFTLKSVLIKIKMDQFEVQNHRQQGKQF